MAAHATQLDPRALDEAVARIRREVAGWSFAPEVDLGGRTVRFFSVQGLGKSGTTWIAELLNLHPEVLCRYEMGLERLFRLVPYVLAGRTAGVDGPEAWRDEVRATARVHLERLATDCTLLYLASLGAGDPKRGTVRLMGDKSPMVPEALLPGVPVLVAMRDGRDRLVSYAYHLYDRGNRSPFEGQHLSGWLGTVLEKFPAEQDGAREGFVRYVMRHPMWVEYGARQFARSVRAAEGLLERHAAGDPTPAMVVRYESLLADVEAERARVYGFLGVDAGAAGPVGEADHTVAGLPGADGTGFYRRGVAGEWREHDDGPLGRVFAELAGDELERMGYDRN